MSRLTISRSFQFRTLPVTCLLFAAVTFAFLPGPAFALRPSMRSIYNNARSQQNQQKQQLVKKLQAELSAARTSLSQAESQLATAAPALQAAKSALETAKERETAKEKESHEAAKQQHELEQKLLAAQGADSPIVVTQKELEQAQAILDQEVHRILSLPDHAAGATEADRARERLSLTAEQKERLKNAPGYVQAAAKVDALRVHLADQQKALFENDATWKEGHARRQTLAQDLKSMEENHKSAATDIARHTKEVKASQGIILSAQQIIQSASSQLTALGSAPKPPAEKK